ncbi:MAG: sigma-70 family RNA polymerase sigma factor [Clostridiales bacterium]|jgi:RNA polymerase sigma-70 factor (ECF subfamily)|nr:sigma-70 family RNA polymerase sigma factor [Clostridiales bacterium]
MKILTHWALRIGSEKALEKIIDKYAAYVCVIIRNTARDLSNEDIEEIASDVFFSLWENAKKIENLKPWLAAVARNKAKNKLRGLRTDLPLDDEIATYGNETEEAFILECEKETVKSAVLSMKISDREIFLRYYYEMKSIAEISDETGLTESAIKHRLARGRQKLRTILESEVLV